LVFETKIVTKKLSELTNDEVNQICELFEICFGQGGIAPTRSKEEYVWRYFERPKNDDDAVFLVLDDNKIISHVALTFSEMYFGNEKLLIGSIDDVMTHPQYRRKGFAKKLMECAIEYSKSENTDGMILITSLNSIAYKLYRKLEFQDVSIFNNFFAITNYGKLFKVLPLRYKLLMIPMAMYSKTKKCKAEKMVTQKSGKLELYEDIVKTHDKMYNGYAGFTPLTKERFIWLTKNSERTSVFLLEKDTETVGYGIVSKRKMKIFGSEITGATIKFGLTDFNYFSTLLYYALEEGKKLDATFLFTLVPDDKQYTKAFKKGGFVNTSIVSNDIGVLMYKPITTKWTPIKTKYIYLNYESATGIP